LKGVLKYSMSGFGFECEGENVEVFPHAQINDSKIPMGASSPKVKDHACLYKSRIKSWSSGSTAQRGCFED
jgi:hypothetical protein